VRIVALPPPVECLWTDAKVAAGETSITAM
jgi:hypothetical protein